MHYLNFKRYTQAGVLVSASGILSASGQATAFLYCVVANVGLVFLSLYYQCLVSHTYIKQVQVL